MAAALALMLAPLLAARTLDIYFVDVEGGQSTLIVTPAGQSLLVDTGFPGDGTFASRPGDPRQARDAGRILLAARDAGIKRIDFLLTTHFHADHDGGVVELAQQIPIRTFIDHGGVLPEAESVAGTLQAFGWYEAVRAKGRHLDPKPGDRLPLKGVEAVVVSAEGAAVQRRRRAESAVRGVGPAAAGAEREPALDGLPPPVRDVPFSGSGRSHGNAAVRARVPERSRR